MGSLLVLLTLGLAETEGAVEGVVRDPQGLAVAGATVVLTLEGEERRVESDAEGRFRLDGVPTGPARLRVDKAGFRQRVRPLIVVAEAPAVVELELVPAGIRERVLVREELSRSSSAVAGALDAEQAQDVPSATNLWAALGQMPGIRMRGYDVGGSHKSTQMGYEANGIVDQHRVLSEGVDSTEGTGGAGVYYDYYAVEEFRVTTAGAGVEMTSPGAQVVMRVKSGGDALSGLYHLDYEGPGMVGDNVAHDKAARGFTGNPNLLYWEAHADLGGPLARDRAWFYGAFNHFTLDKAVSGVDPADGTDLAHFENYTAKITWDVTDRDRLIGYSQLGRKRRYDRGLDALNPVETTRDQDGWSGVHKLEWQRAFSDRLLGSFEARHFGQDAEFLAKSAPETNPERIDMATLRWSGSPGDYFQRRSKPQLAAKLDAFEPFGLREHALKLGLEWFPDALSADNRGAPIRHFDDPSDDGSYGGDRINFTNTPRAFDFINDNFHVYAEDRASFGERLTVTGGVRYSRQHVHYSSVEQRPRYPELFPTGTIPAQSLVTWSTVAPRIGGVVDLAEDGRTLLRASYGRYTVNLGQTIAATHPSVHRARNYAFADPNRNGIFDGFHELGDLVYESGGVLQSLDGELAVSYADELSVSMERELPSRGSIRASFVRKVLKNDFGNWDVAQGRALLVAPVPCGDAVFPCPPHPFTGEPLALVRLPEKDFGISERLIETYPDPRYAYDTLSFFGESRPRDDLWLAGSFDYQWRDELKGHVPSVNPLETDPIGGGYFQNHHPSVPNRQRTTTWQARLLSRLRLPGNAAVAVNLRHQSGFNWAPLHFVNVPGSFRQRIYLEDLAGNRSDDVTLLDLRVDKTFALPNGRLSLMLDAYNLLNSSAVTNFVVYTFQTYGNVLAALDPRTFKVGLRYEF